MKITNWQFEIDKIDWLILSSIILNDDNKFVKSTLNVNFNLIDGSFLEFHKNINFNKNKYKYSFQWMNIDKKLIRRWDNAPHHFQIPTYPFHQHIRSEENVHPSEEMNLEKVLDFIGKNLQ